MNFLSLLSQYIKTIDAVFSATWWFVLPIGLFYVFKVMYVKYKWALYYGGLKWVMLEIKTPRDIEKSPKTMEQVIIGLHGAWSTPSYYDQYFIGKFQQTRYSLEIQGVNGEMHLYIRCEKRLRNLVESLIYSQYPEAEIEEVEDYTLSVPRNIPNPEWNLWGADFYLTKADAYPIRTYKKFQEEVTGKMLDPMATMADAMAVLPPGQQVWIQILAIPVKDDDWAKPVKKLAAKLAYKEVKKESLAIVTLFVEAFDILASSIKHIFGPIEEKKEEKKDDQPLMFKLTPMEKDILAAVEESLSKKAFKVKYRIMTLGTRDNFDKANAYPALGSIYQFNDPNLNTFKTDNRTKTYANYFFRKSRMLWSQRKIWARYLVRDNDGPNFILNTEELATIFHLPDMSAMSPAIGRVEAKKGGAPTNLPME